MRWTGLLLFITFSLPLAAAPRAWRTGDSLQRISVLWRSGPELAAARVKGGPKTNPIAALHAAAGASELRRTEILDISVLDLGVGRSAVDIDRALAIYRASSLVLVAEPDAPIRRAARPNDSAFSAGLQPGLTATAWVQLWDAYPASISFRAAVTVAVLDSGVDAHSDLAPQLLSGKGFVAAEAGTDDRNGHGTFCAGLIAATPNNISGIAGAFIDPAFVKILPVKVLDRCGLGSYSDVTSGILYATAQGARVLNLSLNGLDESDIMRAALAEAQRRGVVAVAAAGNNSEPAGWPASYGTVLSVAALDSSGAPANYSNFGKIELSAPGGNGDTFGFSCVASLAGMPGEIWSLAAWWGSGQGCGTAACASDGRFNAWSGTSFAAPLVAAAAAMLLAQDPDLSVEQVQQRLIQSATATSEGPGFHAKTGWGRLNFYGALTLQRHSGPGAALRAYNWPNPFWPERDLATQIAFFLPAAQAAELRLLDAGGDLVKRWSLGAHDTWAGMNILRWDGSNGSGRKVAAGGYLLVLESAGSRTQHRIAVLR